MNGDGERRRGECKQCGLPVGRRGRAFCCGGCQLAHSLLAGKVASDRPASDQLLARVVVSAFLAMGVMACSLSLYGMEGAVSQESGQALRGLLRLGALALSLPVVLLLGLPLGRVVTGIDRGLTVDGLVFLGVSAAWAASLWNTIFEGPAVYFETATMVLVLYSTGRWLDVRAREVARDRLGSLALERREPALLLDERGESTVELERIRVGDRIRIRPGASIPMDGTVLSGSAFVDTSNLTGEQEPRSVGPGHQVHAGTLNLDGSLDVQVSAALGERVVDEVERILGNLSAGQSRWVRLADRLSAAFLPLVLLLALGTGLYHGSRTGLEAGCLHALAVLLIACPCSLGLATPLAFWIALGEGWKRGLLIHGGEVLERIHRVQRLYLDKTGTLTTGAMKLTSVTPAPCLSRLDCLRLAASLEAHSEHPIGRALVNAWKREGERDLFDVEDFRALPGRGVQGRIEGRSYRIGRGTKEDHSGRSDDETRIELMRGEELLGTFGLVAELRPEAREVVARLRDLGLSPTILTGDAAGPSRALADRVGAPVEHGLFPADKVRSLRRSEQRVAFLGDGLNDAPALEAADVGISMPDSSFASLESASVNLMRDDLKLVPSLFELSRKAIGVARGNLLWACVYNAVGLAWAVSGRLTPVLAATAMVLSSLCVLLNSGRLRSVLPPTPAEPHEAPATTLGPWKPEPA